MGKLPDIVRRDEPDLAQLYQALSRDSRYGHFVRIPRRICRCLDYFKVPADRAAVIERLHSYYLFIGVVDDLIDSTHVEAGREVLRQLVSRTRSRDSAPIQSRAILVTEVLKAHIDPGLNARVLAKFEELYRAVIAERGAETVSIYIEARKAVGRLTAGLSYILISPLLERERTDLCRFLEDVGELGCLVDSLIDLRADRRHGLIRFNAAPHNHLRILATALRLGIPLSLRHPRLIVLFLEALGDNLRDGMRSIRMREDPEQSEVGRAAASVTSETLATVAWTKS